MCPPIFFLLNLFFLGVTYLSASLSTWPYIPFPLHIFLSMYNRSVDLLSFPEYDFLYSLSIKKAPLPTSLSPLSLACLICFFSFSLSDYWSMKGRSYIYNHILHSCPHFYSFNPSLFLYTSHTYILSFYLFISLPLLSLHLSPKRISPQVKLLSKAIFNPSSHPYPILSLSPPPSPSHPISYCSD